MNSKANFKTEQETFWAGSFGTEYIQRNQDEQLLASNINFFSLALRSAKRPKNCIEFGANIGMNLKALKLLYPSLEMHGIEINSDAAKELAKVVSPKNVLEGSILEISTDQTFDLVLIKGVLIHVDPDQLASVYDKLVAATGKYLLVAEYYNPSPVAIPYRGHMNKLFKRDFAGEIMDRRPEMSLIDYGFAYRRDPNFPQDDITWFLMAKNDH